MTNVEQLAQTKTSELLEDRDYLVRAINETIAQIAIGHLTKNPKLSDLEYNQGYESAFEIRNAKYIDLDDLLNEV